MGLPGFLREALAYYLPVAWGLAAAALLARAFVPKKRKRAGESGARRANPPRSRTSDPRGSLPGRGR